MQLHIKNCCGEFCDLVRAMDPDRDIPSSNRKNCHGTNRSNADQDERRRAQSLMKRVLVDTEMARLEDSGQIIELRTPPINPGDFKFIPSEAISASQKEHRLAFLKLSNSESSISSSWDRWDKWIQSFPVENECVSTDEERKVPVDSVRVCGICFHVYNLLSQVRSLLSDEHGEFGKNIHGTAAERDIDLRSKPKISCVREFKVSSNDNESLKDNTVLQHANQSMLCLKSSKSRLLVSESSYHQSCESKMYLSGRNKNKEEREKVLDKAPKFKANNQRDNGLLRTVCHTLSNPIIQSPETKQTKLKIMINSNTVCHKRILSSKLETPEKKQKNRQTESSKCDTARNVQLTKKGKPKLGQEKSKRFSKSTLQVTDLIPMDQTLAPLNNGSVSCNDKVSKKAVHCTTKKLNQNKDSRLLSLKRNTESSPKFTEKAQFNDPNVADGVFEFDSLTSFPYTVMDSSISSSNAERRRRKEKESSNNAFFNIIICHDIFDTLERFKIFMSPIVSQYPGIQVLLWNYPGQSYTKIADGQICNNVFLVECLEKLLSKIGAGGSKEFDSSRPYFLLGYGCGGSVASLYAAKCSCSLLRALLLINPLSFADAHFTSVMHDCRNIFDCSPELRPDLPVYFYSRFLFSPTYLEKVSTPLALNIYTAVHNPITLRGRIKLCDGMLKTVDVRPLVKSIHSPIICINGNCSALMRPIHLQSFSQGRKSCKTIFQALATEQYFKTVGIEVCGGHELLQEIRSNLAILIERLLIGYYEKNDVLVSLNDRYEESARHEEIKQLNNFENVVSQIVKNSAVSTLERGCVKVEKKNETVESTQEESNSLPFGKDNIHLKKSIVSNLEQACSKVEKKNGITKSTQEEIKSLPFEKHRSNLKKSTISNSEQACLKVEKKNETTKSIQEEINSLPFEKHGSLLKQSTISNLEQACLKAEKKNESTKSIQEEINSLPFKKHSSHLKEDKVDNSFIAYLDPSNPAFERQENLVYQPGNSLIYSDLQKFPRIKAQEHMTWRLKRNKRRLLRFQRAAVIIQNALRAFMAKTMLNRLRRQSSSLIIQKNYRGSLGRFVFHKKKKELWAAYFVQRAYRGCLGRFKCYDRRLRTQTQIKIARRWRGTTARRLVNQIIRTRKCASITIQCLWRQYQSKCMALILKHRQNASVVLQKNYRGLISRKKAHKERERYIFSQSQSKGIEFGRELLTEHKLHATRVQSELSILNKDKLQLESRIGEVLAETDTYEKKVTSLEKEMHQLNSVEKECFTNSMDNLKHDFHEQKVRLDQQFSSMLAKIEGRKYELKGLEDNLAQLGKSRQVKFEELKRLERKLVVLLEVQETELAEIKRRQEEKVDNNILAKNAGNHALNNDTPLNLKKQQAAELIDSTETMMKFGFMSMSMTYFSSLNMIKAMKKIGVQHDGTALTKVTDTSNINESCLSKESYSKERKINIDDWNVEDVLLWLSTINLPQYSNMFKDGSVDGPFLSQLTDDDLRNTLGVEHKLHRKKIMFSISKLIENSSLTSEISSTIYNLDKTEKNNTKLQFTQQTKESVHTGLKASLDPDKITSLREMETKIEQAKPSMHELSQFVRNQKHSLLKEAVNYLPSKYFDDGDLREQHVEMIGTVYELAYEENVFHLNVTDDNGNTLLHFAAQNGNVHIGRILIDKGANPNHQNKQGQTPGHYAVAYKFYDFATWLFDSSGGKGNDLLTNTYNLGVYDGISPE